MSKQTHLIILFSLLVILSGCQVFKQAANLSRLDFSLSGVDSPRLAGIDLTSVRSPDDVSPTDMLRLGSAVLRDDLPFDFTLLVAAENPQSNSVDARMMRLDWTLLLDDRETVSGFSEPDVVIAPGTTAELPTVISLNLLEFFESGLPDLIDLALAVSGGGDPTRVKLQATPTVTTVLGPIKYPVPITIVSKVVGG
jgi:hypothetical protein